jgi:hypothetical protein
MLSNHTGTAKDSLIPVSDSTNLGAANICNVLQAQVGFMYTMAYMLAVILPGYNDRPVYDKNPQRFMRMARTVQYGDDF